MIRTYRTVSPINPDEAAGSKRNQIPDAVIEEFNRLIVRNLRSGQAGVSQDEVLTALEGQGYSRKEVFDNNWLDVEGLYRQVGWKVEYIKPDPDGSFRAFFRFTRKENKQQQFLAWPEPRK
jgi:hypothetical protein